MPGQNAFISATCGQITALNFSSIDVEDNVCNLLGPSSLPAQVPTLTPVALLMLMFVLGVSGLVTTSRFKSKKQNG